MSMTAKSLDRLQRVHPDLQLIVTRADLLGEMDFIVIEGERTLEKQKAFVAKGASTTMRSRHVREMNQCGEVCAVDLGVMIDGELRWDGNLYMDLAYLMKEATEIEGVPVVWGGCWSDISKVASVETAQYEYVRRKRAKGERPFIDGPHFELPWGVYP